MISLYMVKKGMFYAVLRQKNKKAPIMGLDATQ
nr:MAG TPA: hypothetical protein [Caudoviricetes sp.]